MFTLLLFAVHATLFALPANAATLRWFGHCTAMQPHIKAGWEQETGNVLDFQCVSSDFDLYQGTEQDLLLNEYYDLYSSSAPFAPFWDAGLIRDLTQDVQDPQFLWQEVTIAARTRQAQYACRIGAAPIDSDSYLMYYRRDIIGVPPATWEEYLALAREWHGKDINGDGIPDYGTCINADLNLGNVVVHIASTVLKYESGMRQGYVYDISDDDSTPMTSVVNSEAYRYALRMTRDLWNYSFTEPIPLGTIYGMFAEGRCATYLSFPSAGTQTVRGTSPYLQGRLGVARGPGSRMVYDRATRSLVPCTVERCPLMETGSINRPQFLHGGNSLFIRKNTPNVDLALSFVAYYCRNADTRLAGGINPFRARHFNVTWYLEAPIPWNRIDAELYTSAIQDVMQAPHVTGHLRAPTTQVIRGAIAEAAMKYLRMNNTIYANTTDSLDKIVADLDRDIELRSIASGYSMEAVEQALRRDFGLPPYVPATSSVPVGIIVPVVLVAVILIAIAAFFGYKSWSKNRFAPKNSTAPIAVLFIGPRNISTLHAIAPDKAGYVLDQFNRSVRKHASQNKCYIVKRIGDFFMIVAEDPVRLTNCSREVLKEMVAHDWEMIDAVLQAPAKRVLADSVSVRSESKESARSRRSKHTATAKSATGTNVSHRAFDMSVSFSGGIHYGNVIVNHDPERETYDYSGLTVDVAAAVSDAALPNQVVSSVEVSSYFDECSSTFNGRLAEFRTFNFKNADRQLYQLEAEGLPKLVPPRAGEVKENVDSVMNALEQDQGGLTKKRITVLVVDAPEITSYATRLQRDDMMEKYTKIVASIDACIKPHRGYLHSFNEDRIIVTFNATHPTANQTARAGQAALDIRCELEKKFKLQGFCGLASGSAFVGSRDHRDIVIGTNLFRQAVSAAALSRAHAVPCVASAAIANDASTALYFQYVDYVRLPGTEKVSPLVGLMAATNQGGEADEWLYELERADDANPFSLVNSAFHAWEKGDNEQCAAKLEAASQSKSANDVMAAVSFLREAMSAPADARQNWAEQRGTMYFGTLQ